MAHQIRRCILCFQSYPQSKMLRLIKGTDNQLYITTEHALLVKNRGFYVCLDPHHLYQIKLMHNKHISQESIEYIKKISTN